MTTTSLVRITPRPALMGWAAVPLVAVAYFAAAAFSFLLTTLPGHMSPIFPAAGIGLAAVLILGRRALPGIWLGSFTANATFDPNAHGLLHLHLADVAILGTIGLGAVAGSALGAWLVRRLSNGEHPLHSARNLLVFFAVGCCSAAAASASIGVLTIVLAGVIPWRFSGYAALTWFLGDGAGIILTAPLSLAWHTRAPWLKRPGSVLEAILLGSTTVLLCDLVFFHRLPFEYGLMPLLGWAAFRFGLRGTTLEALAIAVFATIGTSLGTSPFVRGTVNDSLLALHSFLAVTIIFSLLLAAVLAERTRAEREVSQSEARYRKLVEHAPEALLVLDGERGTIVDLNDNACRLFQLSREQLLTLGPVELSPEVQPDGRPSRQKVADYLARAKAGEAFVFEWAHRNAGGEELPCQVQLSRLPSSSGIRIRVSLLDITERKRAEEEKARLEAQLLQSQKMESLGLLAGGVAHDMNNVLGAILLLATRNLATLDPESPVHRSFEAIAQAANRGGKMVRSLLGFSRQSPVQVRAVDVNAVLREEAELLERTIPSRIRLVLELAPGLPPLHGDANALAHVFMNLCVNALDAMPEAGTLTLRTFLGTDGWLEVQAQDTGQGMTPEVRERALEPFFTTKPQGKGTGLGLSMAYATVKAHHGEFDLQSEPGRGTLVRLRFPTATVAAEPPAPEAEPVLDSLPLDSRPLDILVVDDDFSIRESVEAVLEHLGHTTTCAASGEEALERLGTGYRPDLIILDMNMPGLGGEKTLPLVRSLCPRVPVLLATGRVDQAALAITDADPCVSMLSKPFGMKELRQCLGAIGRA